MDSEIKQSSKIKFYLHDVERVVNVTEDMDPSMTLNHYIRDVLNLKGTKKLCLEGGCGSCIVVLHKTEAGKPIYLAVNSCLVSILSCQGWNISTIEGIGGPKDKYHPVQEVLAKFNGTQCGFCSSGMVMNMYALYESNPNNLKMADVENSFGGNICRCTGYRPILAAFKSLCVDASSDLLGQFPDIEELKICDKGNCKKTCEKKCEGKMPYYHALADDKRWVKVTSLVQLLGTLKSNPNNSTYKLVAGNTAKGVFKATYSKPVNLYIDISEVPELKKISLAREKIEFGAGNSLTTAIQQFAAASRYDPSYSYMQKLSDHIDLIANVPVRNIGTIAGNLMMKHDHNDFPSDMFLILETSGAEITIVDVNNVETKVRPHELIKADLHNKVILMVTFSPHDPDLVKYESYKIMPRAQNTHANVNAGFLFTFDKTNLISDMSIVIGNINANFIHATKTENFLKGKRFEYTMMQEAFEILAGELEPEPNPPDPHPEFRKQLAIALFYKTILAHAPVQIIPAIKSGGPKLLRPAVSHGAQDYDTKESLYPLTQAIPKIEALAQTSGQAEYIGDMPDLPHQLHAAFVLAAAPPRSVIIKIDPAPALAMTGVEHFFSASDIVGQNNYKYFGEKEEIFCSKTVLYYEQPLGLLLADTEQVLEEAVKKVNVTYSYPQNSHPILSVRQIMKENLHQERIHEEITLTPSRKGNDVKKTIKGTFDIYHQYHFHMETQCCNVVPTEQGLNIYPSTQWIEACQGTISNVLKIPRNQINISIRRLGGGFGAKITRSHIVSCAAALAAWKLRRPVKLSLSLPDNIKIFGKRWPLCMDYEAGVNTNGVIQYLEVHQYSDLGAVGGEMGINEQVGLFMGNYDSSTFYIHVNSARTDTCVNTWARAPGSTEGLCSIEAIMDHIAYETKLDPLEIRKANVTKNQNILKYMVQIKEWADIDKRKAAIADFNKNNRWKKKGMSVVPMTYGFGIGGLLSAVVSIFRDGSVTITHGGVEIGQGINTKAAQVCAYKLKIPLEHINVIPSTSVACPNNNNTGGSATSEAICYAVTKACDVLLSRLQRHHKAKWEDTVSAAANANEVLSATGSCTSNDPGVGYQIYGICATEVTVDILTGQHIVDRVDLIEDAGQAISPLIDIGQVEGAFIMGLGYHTSERIVHDEKTGQILTTNTWTYHPPGAKDIPVDFRVRFPKNNPNDIGILQSKATAEPPLCLTVSVPLAVRNAVASARLDSKPEGSAWFPFDGPTTVENTFMNSFNDYKEYRL